MRGEHAGIFLQVVATLGSSPHARGTRQLIVTVEDFRGIIPACAGNTKVAHTCELKLRDHPRMRGEHEIGDDMDELLQGSSPHARGTPTGRASEHQPHGIIPACAGNTVKFTGV